MKSRVCRRKWIIILISSLLVIIIWCLCEKKHQYSYYKSLSEEELTDDIVFGNSSDAINSIRLVKLGEKRYAAFLPNEMNEKTKLFFEAFKKLRIDNLREYQSGDSIGKEIDGVVYRAEIVGWDDECRGEIEITFYHGNGIPTVYIETNDGTTAEIDYDKAVEIEAQLLAVGIDGERKIESVCKISGRGNSSYSQKQKPYNIEFDRKIPLLEMTQGCKWSLLANYSDCMQHMRNKFTYDIAERFGLKYSPESQFCNLYVDGQYRGMYLLVRKSSFDDAYSLQMSSRYYNEYIHFPISLGQPVVLKNYKNFSDDEIVNIAVYVRNVVDVLANPLTPDDELEKVFDYDSWARYYILQDFATEFDLEYDSFKFYKRSDDLKLYAGPIWDFDLAYGVEFFGKFPRLTEKTMWIKDDRGGWLRTMVTRPRFDERVNELYINEFFPIVDDYLKRDFYGVVEKNEDSYIMNATRWGREIEDYSEKSNEFYQWIINRQAFLQDYLLNPSSYNKVTFQFGWKEMSYYVKHGERLGYLPLPENGEFDNNHETVVSWRDENRNSVTEEMIVDNDMVLYAVTQNVPDGI